MRLERRQEAGTTGINNHETLQDIGRFSPRASIESSKIPTTFRDTLDYR